MWFGDHNEHIQRVRYYKSPNNEHILSWLYIIIFSPGHEHILSRPFSRPGEQLWIVMVVMIPAFSRRHCHLKLRFAVHTSGLCEFSNWRHVLWLDQQSNSFTWWYLDVSSMLASNKMGFNSMWHQSALRFQLWNLKHSACPKLTYWYLTFTASLQALWIQDLMKSVPWQLSESWCYGASRNLATNRSKSCKWHEVHEVFWRFQKFQKLLLGVWILFTSLNKKKQTVDLPRFAVW